jgi:hemerythrin
VKIEWDETLEVGVEAIDEQHKELFRRLDRLLQAMQTRQGAVEVGRLIDYLGEYVVAHFGLEESVMRDRAYPAYAAHKAEHEAFLKDFQMLRAEYLSSGPNAVITIRVTNRVTAWLREHIYRIDRALGQYLQKRP